ncbi:MAG: response regulator [Myxococcota bacterium]
MSRPVHVLVVDDNPDDVDLLRLCLARAAASCVLSVAEDGDRALATLRACPPGDPVRLVLLDLNMPGRSGRDVLREMRADPRLAGIPVVVLSSSDAPDDVATLYRLGASCYLLKPTGLEEFRELARQLDAFWLRTALLPG